MNISNKCCSVGNTHWVCVLENKGLIHIKHALVERWKVLNVTKFETGAKDSNGSLTKKQVYTCITFFTNPLTELKEDSSDPHLEELVYSKSFSFYLTENLFKELYSVCLFYSVIVFVESVRDGYFFGFCKALIWDRYVTRVNRHA